VGAVPALNCAKILTGIVKLNYVAINDGAFFAARGEVTFNPFTIVMSKAPIVAGQMDNFFQTFGHELLRDKRGPGGFMDGTEFHGPLDGFNNIDLAKKPGPKLKGEMDDGARRRDNIAEGTPGRLRLLKRNADAIHQAAADQAEVVIEQEKAKFFKP
jgi:hypothetical protein